MFKGQTRQVPLKIEGHSITGYCAFGPAQSMHECIFDTGAEFSAIPQKIWSLQYDRKAIDIAMFETKHRRSVFGHKCRAKRVPLQIWIMGDADASLLRGDGSEAHANDYVVDFGECWVDLLFDQDAAEVAAAAERTRQLKEKELVAFVEEHKPQAKDFSGTPPEMVAKVTMTPVKTMEALSRIYIGLGGGTFRNGGLCINWTIPEAVLVEQISS